MFENHSISIIMSDTTDKRKIHHVNIVNADSEVDRRKYYFDSVQLVHRALPEIDLSEVDPSITFMGKRLSFPLLISSMTGGDHNLLRTINKNLAIAAEATGVAMCVGSQRVMFTNPKSKSSFEIRKFAPNALLFANLGAVQLNYGFTLEMCKQAIATVAADALYFHLNPLQEAIQPEGNTNFSGLAEKIGGITKNLQCPVVLKEVGTGISKKDIELVQKYGIKYIDIAGSGGTSWSRVEHHRRDEGESSNLGILFQDWGNPTPFTLQMLRPFRQELILIASGGVRSGIDMVKSIILGASLCGIATPFLEPAMESPDKVIGVIEGLKREFAVAMFLLGVSNFNLLHCNDSLIANPDFNTFNG